MIEKANGSAMVTLGNTQVLAGVKIDKGTPFPDTPDKGLLIVGAEVLPMAAAYLEAGPPDESAIELARVVDRGVRESEMIDVSSLVHKGGQVGLLRLLSTSTSSTWTGTSSTRPATRWSRRS